MTFLTTRQYSRNRRRDRHHNTGTELAGKVHYTYLQAVEVPSHRRERGGRVARQVPDGQVRPGLGQRADAAGVAPLGGDQRRRQAVLVGEVTVGSRVQEDFQAARVSAPGLKTTTTTTVKVSRWFQEKATNRGDGRASGARVGFLLNGPAGVYVKHTLRPPSAPVSARRGCTRDS